MGGGNTKPYPIRQDTFDFELQVGSSSAPKKRPRTPFKRSTFSLFSLSLSGTDSWAERPHHFLAFLAQPFLLGWEYEESVRDDGLKVTDFVSTAQRCHHFALKDDADVAQTLDSKPQTPNPVHSIVHVSLNPIFSSTSDAPVLLQEFHNTIGISMFGYVCQARCCSLPLKHPSHPSIHPSMQSYVHASSLSSFIPSLLPLSIHP
jgi:hypothetical protein